MTSDVRSVARISYLYSSFFSWGGRISGKVYYSPVRHKMTFEGASKACLKENAVLANPGQLHAAWRLGLDRCDYGWLSDGSARHPVAVPKRQCGGGLLGVRTMYRFKNQTGFPEPATMLGAYCFKGKSSQRNKLLPAHGTIKVNCSGKLLSLKTMGMSALILIVRLMINPLLQTIARVNIFIFITSSWTSEGLVLTQLHS